MARPTPSLTLALMQARESAMDFFRPHLNRHNITEQQWRVIRILWQSEDQTLESHRLRSETRLYTATQFDWRAG